MAKKKTKAKKKSDRNVTVGPQSITISLDANQAAAAKKCLDKSGNVKFTIKEVSVEDLPGVASSAVIID